jgi:P pilus assembly chaperone PapD
MTILVRAALAAATMAALLAAAPVHAELVLSELIVELHPGTHAREDVEVWNDSPDRAFVAVQPRQILDPALPSQSAREDPDPEKLGILVSPARMILEPGQRKLIRVAALPASPDRERVYRVTVKPVAGRVQSDASGLKILLGYDVLVLVRPAVAAANVVAVRNGRSLTFDNRGNVSVEIVDGRQCAARATQCAPLPGKRLYAGAAWTVQLQSDLPAEYTLKSPGRADRRTF